MSYESDDKMVSHPDHYQSGKYEVIDIIEEFTKDLSGIEAVDTGNAIKYVLRWHKKNGVQDVKKAIWYLTHLAEHLEEKEKPIKPHSVVIHKLSNGHYAIEDIKDDEKIDKYDGPDEHCRTCKHAPTTPENDKICEDCYGRENYEPDTVFVTGESIDKEEPGLSVNKIISGMKDNGCTFVEAGTDTEKIDKEESKLCAENHINSVGICVPDSEPWGTPGIKREEAK